MFFPSGGNAQVYQNNQLKTQFFGEKYDGTHDNCLNALNIVKYCAKKQRYYPERKDKIGLKDYFLAISSKNSSAKDRSG